ncbi:MAG: 50S ribosomal protein L17 [Bacteroidales bacterium]|jgi:large subunit ribosomal protein L17|nr:50S ribosomal protein L17 [Bacteroidales bacterium]
MRHGKKTSKLGRKSAHRKAMFANMASSLIIHKRITTTLAKGKALRVYVEPLITKSKDDSTHSRRTVFSYLQNKEAVTELFREVSVKVADRPGGYTRVLKLGPRLGDSAEMCMIELVDYNENLLSTKEAAKAKTTRRRRGTGKKKSEDAVAAPATQTKVEEIAEEAKDVIEEVEVKADEVVEEVEDVVAEGEKPEKAEEPQEPTTDPEEIKE